MNNDNELFPEQGRCLIPYQTTMRMSTYFVIARFGVTMFLVNTRNIGAAAGPGIRSSNTAPKLVHRKEVKIQLRSGYVQPCSSGDATVATKKVKTAPAKSNKPVAKRAPKSVPQTKSARFVSLLKSGKSIAEVQKITGDGYAFIYGVAKRNNLHLAGANRRSVRAISIDRSAGTVTVQTSEGPVVVNTRSGEVTGGHRPVKTPVAKKTAVVAE